MAWQSQSAMAGSGGAAGGAVDGSNNGAGQPQGTEYTLQGAYMAKWWLPCLTCFSTTYNVWASGIANSVNI